MLWDAVMVLVCGSISRGRSVKVSGDSMIDVCLMYAGVGRLWDRSDMCVGRGQVGASRGLVEGHEDTWIIPRRRYR